MAIFKTWPFALRALALTLIIVAMARPQTVDVSTKTKTTRGIDIVMAPLTFRQVCSPKT